MSKLHVIWDLDGTLINSESEVLQALIKSVREVGLTESDQRAPFRVGPTIDKILDEAFDEKLLSSEKKSAIVKIFRNRYDNCGFNNTLPFDGVEKILKDARFIHHIVTNKPDLATNRILERLGWRTFFESVITPYSFMKTPSDSKKSKTELFSICMKQYPSEKFVGVGDMETDAKAAIANNIPAIGVLWGTGTKEELSGCVFIANTTSELHGFLGCHL
ncbi:MAG: HAD family hydrolase [Clostridiales bacterium]|nr:HAD family hydrolase [Clostridiales bacterium]